MINEINNNAAPNRSLLIKISECNLMLRPDVNIFPFLQEVALAQQRENKREEDHLVY